MRAVEFFCGIGGFAAALGNRGAVALAIDQNPLALKAYRRNFPETPLLNKVVQSVDEAALARLNADLWWASPPCQPFTAKGRQRGLADPRAAPFLTLLQRLARAGPRFFALENVPGFADSEGCQRLHETLGSAGYRWIWQGMLCPSQLGVPNHRLRFFLVAGRAPLRDPMPFAVPSRPLADYLDEKAPAALMVSDELLARYRRAMDLVDPSRPEAIAKCFASGYGRAATRCGSYIPTPAGGARRFAPAEIKRLLGFPEDYALPESLTMRQRWKLLGNSLSAHCVRTALSAIPGLDFA